MNKIQIVQMIIDNQDTILSCLGLFLAFLKATAWGRSKAAALDLVVKAVEESENARHIKSKVAVAQQDAPSGVRASIDTAVAVADPKKTPDGVMARFAREMTRVK